MSAALNFLDEIKRGAKTLGISPSTLCQKSVKNGRLVKRLAQGGDVEVGTVERIRAFIKASSRKLR